MVKAILPPEGVLEGPGGGAPQEEAKEELPSQELSEGELIEALAADEEIKGQQEEQERRDRYTCPAKTSTRTGTRTAAQAVET